MAEPRRTFGPVVLLGAAAGTLAAVAGNKAWVASVDGNQQATPLAAVEGVGEMPLAAALSLVVLACWGVLLVTRARVRRAVAVLGLLAAAGLVATVVTALVTLQDQTLDALRAQPALTGQQVTTDVGWTGWFWAAAVGAMLSVVATAAAVRFVPAWPEMGSRYDAPTGGSAGSPQSADDDADATNLGLWKALDEGRDPTA